MKLFTRSNRPKNPHEAFWSGEGVLLSFVVVLVWLVAGCSGGGNKTGSGQDVGPDSSPVDVRSSDNVRFADTGTDLHSDLVPELTDTDTSLDGVDLDGTDADVWKPVACGSHDDCEDGYCVEYPPGEGSFFCAPTCLEECPGDWVCKSIFVDGPDPVSLCLPPKSTLCKSCQQHKDCILASSLCVVEKEGAYGYCGKVCNPEDDNCPEGFSCTLYEDADDKPMGYQCLPQPGSCCVVGEWSDCNDDNPCTGEGCSPALGCTHEPVDVPCSGSDPCFTYACLEGECLATPIAEDVTWDGIDDDCDGMTDEDTYKSALLAGYCFTDGGGSVSQPDGSVEGAFWLGSTPWAGSMTGGGFRLTGGLSAPAATTGE